MDEIYKNYLLSNNLLTIKAATAEQTTTSKSNDNLVTDIMLETLAKVKKSYLLSAINKINLKHQSLKGYFFEGLGFQQSDINQLKKLYCYE